MARLVLRTYWRRLMHKWDALHVERHGMYSLERMYRFKVFCERTSLPRAVAVLVLTPLPCLAIAITTDLLPLEPPEKGFSHSALFWVRLLLVSWLILFAVLKQCRRFVVGVPMRLIDVACASLFVAAGATASALWLASRIGFPLPFTIGLESPVALVLLVVALTVLWGKYLPRNRSLQRDLLNCVLVILTQLTLTYVYPAYNFVFQKLGAYPQVAFALLLPAMKITAKNWMSFLLQSLEDLKPEFIILNIEVFHALFVSSCMQNAASASTTVILLGTDFMFGALALRRILKTIRTFHSSVNPVSSRGSTARGTDATAAERHTRSAQWNNIHFLDVAIFLVETNPSLLKSRAMSLYTQGTIPKISQVQPSNSVRSPRTSNATSHSVADASTRSSHVSQSVSSFVQDDSTVLETDSTAAAAKVHQVQGPTLPQLEAMTQPKPHKLHHVRVLLNVAALREKLTPDDKRLVASLNEHDRLRYVQHVLRLLFWTEFILLVEFTEVVVPIVYSTSYHSCCVMLPSLVRL